MDSSILIVGDQVLHHIIKKLLSKTKGLMVSTATTAVEAEAIINAHQPAILVMQADNAELISLSQRIHAQNRLAWIYQIFVGNSTEESTSGTWGMKAAARALEQGADSYFPGCSLIDLDDSSSPERSSRFHSQQQLLQAQVCAGLRRVQKVRELVRANDVLSAIALSDPLTELNNRRAFEWDLPRQIQVARTRKTPISLLMLDIDFFKAINDNYGHLVGDQALRMVANRLRHNLRFYDTPFRYGGEEFSIILNNTTDVEAAQIGERICQLMSKKSFVIDSSLQLNITLSIGSASLHDDDDDDGLSLLQRADQNLLRAKSNGRNQLVSDALPKLVESPA